MKKKKTRRSNAPFPALDPRLNLKTRWDENDYDYIDKLPESWTDPKTGKVWSQNQLKQYLNDFTNEHIHADFTINKKEGRKRIHPKKKIEHQRNNHLKKLLNDLLLKIKEFIQILNDSQITVRTKTKFKKTTNKFKDQLKKQIQKEFKYIEDFYKKNSEQHNNNRNDCILTTKKAQGLTSSFDTLSQFTMNSQNSEDQIIEAIDNKNIDIED